MLIGSYINNPPKGGPILIRKLRLHGQYVTEVTLPPKGRSKGFVMGAASEKNGAIINRAIIKAEKVCFLPEVFFINL